MAGRGPDRSGRHPGQRGAAARRHHRRGDGGGQGRRLRARHAAGRPGRPGRRRDLAGRRHPRRGAGAAPGRASRRRCWPGCTRPGCRCTRASPPASTSAPAAWPAGRRAGRGRPAGRADRPGSTSSSTPGWPAAAPPPADWPALLEAAAKAQADGDVEVVGRLEPLRLRGRARPRDRSTGSWPRSPRGWPWPSGTASAPRYRHIANSAATLTRPDAHYDLVRPGIAIYGLSPLRGRDLSGCARR